MAERAPWLHLSSEHEGACVDSDDCLDALICAIVARATERGLTEKPPSELRDEAEREGWIQLPRADVPLEELL